jgi:hypothetical protein
MAIESHSRRTHRQPFKRPRNDVDLTTPEARSDIAGVLFKICFPHSQWAMTERLQFSVLKGDYTK